MKGISLGARPWSLVLRPSSVVLRPSCELRGDAASSKGRLLRPLLVIKRGTGTAVGIINDSLLI